MNRKLIIICCTLLTYVLLVVSWGYQFGRGDLVQLDPLMVHAAHPELYPNDLYVQEAESTFPNERFFFLLLLRPFTGHLEWVSFLYHVFFSLLLLMGLYRLSSRYLHSTWLRLAVPLIVFIPLYGINLGQNELYYGIFHPSLVAKSIGIWSIVFWLRRRVILALSVAALSTLFHPVAGLQVFSLVVAGEALWSITDKKSWLPKRLFIGILIWFCTAGLFLILVHRRFETGVVPEGMDLYQIFYVFRNPHHYLPAAFGQRNWVILTPLIILGSIIWFFRESRLGWFFVAAFISLGIYCAGVQMRSETITTLQWFKSTIWLEMLSVIALLHMAENILDRMPATLHKAALPVILLLPVLWGALISPGNIYRQATPYYDLPFRDYTDDAIDISRQAKALTPTDALFIHPCGFTELKFFGERSSYVDYKALTHSKAFLTEWARRLQYVYHLDYTSSPAGYATSSYADEQLGKLSTEELKQMYAEKGIGYLITYRTSPAPDLPVMASNDTYVLYRIAP
ncbi:MAG: hypothetical protein H6548_07575 [Chitinophagales bacterium]|nr:hypothetical protein [Chitinophagales bacterium]HAE13621.1 hypothetical protein [Bacteroidota bacterium]MCB9021959.1 hypothetical protein [Chitinophagales bacterium]HPE97650.1 hypothetical protein [Chitinophagales bacterium]HQU39159.1 hypothetical protein [Chitinophagales bacterium]